MTREDEIRQRLAAIKGMVSCNDPYQSTADFEFCQNAPDDLSYLLEKVEQLKLEVYRCHVDHDEFGPCECDVCVRVRSKPANPD